MFHLHVQSFLLALVLVSSNFWSISPHTSHLSPHSLYGIASWYGPTFHGRTTANGEIFNKDGLTAAHRTLPFNTKVLVTNLKNNKSVIVRINDRGPYIEGRVIDLSEESAHRIDSKLQGIAYVKLLVLNK